MDRELTIWLLIFAVGAITYTARLSFIALFARRDMPPLLAEALKHVPVAMLTAIVVPLCFLAVLVPLLRDRVSIAVFAIAAVAVVALDAMPLRLSMICSGLLGIAAGIVGDKVTGKRG